MLFFSLLLLLLSVFPASGHAGVWAEKGEANRMIPLVSSTPLRSLLAARCFSVLCSEWVVEAMLLLRFMRWSVRGLVT